VSAGDELCVFGDELIWSDDWLGVELVLVLGEVLDVWATATAADSASTKINIIRRFLIRCISPWFNKGCGLLILCPQTNTPNGRCRKAVWGRQRAAVHIT
jgi:hypothetical protein